jgi:hypothetical protein
MYTKFLLVIELRLISQLEGVREELNEDFDVVNKKCVHEPGSSLVNSLGT